MIINESNQYCSNDVPKKFFLMLKSNSFKSDRNRIGCWASIYTNLSEIHCKNQLKPDQYARFDLTFTLDPPASSCRENVVKRFNTVNGNVKNSLLIINACCIEHGCCVKHGCHFIRHNDKFQYWFHWNVCPVDPNGKMQLEWIRLLSS